MVATFRVPYDDFDYVPSDEDIIWAAVALYGETRGHHSEAEWGRILWTWMNRFMLHVPRPRVWPTLADLIKHHSQPVNPKWRLGGSRCPVETASGNCTGPRLRWRRKMADLIGMGWSGLEQLPAGLADFTLRFFNGEVPQELGNGGLPMVDFGVTAAGKKHGTRYESGANYFLTSLQSQAAGLLSNFLMEEVVVVGGGGSSEPVNDDYFAEESSTLKYVAVGLWGAATLTALWYLLKPRG